MKQFILIILVLLPVCVFAQFNETFSGPEIDSENPWKGDLDKFVINSDGWLQLNGLENEPGKVGLHCNIPYASTMQWEFDVRIEKAPSDKNYIRLYLYMESDGTYYYVQVGHDGAKKISLRTNNKEKLFPLKDSGLTEEPILLHMKVTLEDNKVWTLYSRKQGESSYRLEGSTDKYPLKTTTTNGELTFNVEYSKTRYQHFAIDNLNVSYTITPTDTIPDETPVDPDTDNSLPKLLSVEPLSLSEIQFVFNKPVYIFKAQFTVSGIGKAERMQYADDKLKTIVNTRFPGEFVLGKNYLLSYDGLTDMNGTKLASFSKEVVLTDDEGTPAGSVVINEVMADPKGLKKLPETEYVEIYNTTQKSMTLAGWQFSYGGKSKQMNTFVLPGNGYAVLYRSGRNIEVDPLAVKVPLDNFPTSLANAGKQLRLYNASMQLVDEVTYQKATPAKSWERTHSGSWQLSTDPRGGTPGSANSSEGGKPVDPDDPDEPVDPDNPEEPDTPFDPTTPVEPHELVFNELLPNPFVGGSEYIELYNRSDHPLSLSGLAVATRKTDGSLNTRYPLSSVAAMIEPDHYALLTKSKAGVEDFYSIQSPTSLFEIPKLPVLANTTSTLVLFRTSDDVVIDEVSYSSKWHAPSVKNQKGVALERISPEAETQSPSNWTSAAATAGYGTPGYQNSQSETSSPDHPTGIEAPEWIPGSEHYEIAYYLDQPGYSCRAFIYNPLGQRVAEIANHELLGLTGQFTWDGSSLSGKRLRTGAYIFYAELYHIDGTVKRYKQVFLVR